MRLVRALSLPLAVGLAVSALSFYGSEARAESHGEAEEDAETAGQRAEVASGLVDAAVANRTGIETELALTIAQISDLAAQLSEVSVGLDRLRGQIGLADAELDDIEASIEVQAVDAYMTALTFPGVSFVSSDTVEEALVAGTVVEEVVNHGMEQVDQLVAKKRALESLQQDYLAKQEAVAALKADVQAEVERLALLYEQADAAVAVAIRKANTADAEYRAALSAVDAAQAREAERIRQEERDRTTTTTPPGTTPTTNPPQATTTTSDGGSWTFPPAVEQWRSVVEQYFPSHRIEEALRIIQCESNGDPDAYNPYSGASGLFQFLPPTWATTAPKAGFPDASPFEPTANIATAAWLANRYEQLGLYYWQPWSCRRVL
jgi:septal ring factor EnvC (AmiA/AmiB activator)